MELLCHCLKRDETLSEFTTYNKIHREIQNICIKLKISTWIKCVLTLAQTFIKISLKESKQLKCLWHVKLVCSHHGSIINFLPKFFFYNSFFSCINKLGGVFHEVEIKIPKLDLIISSNSSHAIMFPFEPLGKRYEPLILPSQLWVKQNHTCPSIGIALALDKPRRLICH